MAHPPRRTIIFGSDDCAPTILTAEGVGGHHIETAQGVGVDESLWHGRRSVCSVVTDYGLERTTHASNKGQGLWFGVIFPITSNIFGVILFLRAPWIVGKAGIANAFGLVFVCCTCTLVTALSLCAVATNGKILGGGSYYIISRSLGPALGAGVGLCVYMANSIGAAMYLMGTVEAWEMAMPSAQIFEPGDINNIRVTAILLLAACVFIVSFGVKVVSKLGTAFLFTSLTVILFMYLGCFIGPDHPGTQPSVYTVEWKTATGVDTLTLSWGGIARASDYFSQNWGPGWDEPQRAYAADTTAYSFISMMGLWFPANTCIMAGSNRSADLKDPSRDIPRGTLCAQVGTSIVYLSLIIIYGCVAPRETLLNDKFFASTAAWPLPELVIYGVMASTIDASFASLVSGSRLLNAIANDGTVPILRFLAASPGKEPRKAVIASGLLGACAVGIGELNSVAPVLTMFFLMCYTCVNASCTVLQAVQDPNWRPTFRFHHWSVSLFGTLLCITMMFCMSVIYAVIAIAFCLTVMGYAAYHSHAVKWGDGFQGIKFQLARNVLMKMHLTAHTKNWRPQVLVITEADVEKANASMQASDGHAAVNKLKVRSPDLLKFVSQLKGGRGITIVGGLCDSRGVSGLSEGGSFLRATNAEGVEDGGGAMKMVLEEFGIEGFGQLLYTDNFVEGVQNMVQTAGLGAFKPNCVMMSWPEEAAWMDRAEVGLTARSRMVKTVQTAVVFNKVMLVTKGVCWPKRDDRMVGSIDIWWIVGDGGVLLLLPFLLKKSKVWQGCKTRLFVVADRAGADPERLGQDLKEYVKDFRLQVDIFVQTLDTDAIASEEPHGGAAKPASPDGVHDATCTGAASVGAVGAAGPPAGTSALGVAQPTNGHASANADLFRQVSPSGCGGLARQISEEKAMHAHGSLQRQVQGKADAMSRSFVSSADQLVSSQPCSVGELAVALALGNIMAKASQGADLVVTNLPDMPPDESAYGYFEIVDAMTRDLKRCLLVRGTAQDVITQFT